MIDDMAMLSQETEIKTEKKTGNPLLESPVDIFLNFEELISINPLVIISKSVSGQYSGS